MSPRVSEVGIQAWHVSTVLLETADNIFAAAATFK